MKLSFSSLSLFLATTAALPVLSMAELGCTHGKLFVSDTETTMMHVFDLNGASLAGLAVEDTLEMAGSPGINLAATGASHSGSYVATIYRGAEDQFYADGIVSWVNTGVTAEEHDGHMDISYDSPQVVRNGDIECARAIHFVPHDQKVAIFCDGSYDAGPQINSTVWVVDETVFSTTASSPSAVVFQTTLQGSHHGVAIPVDDGHVLYSLAEEERINRGPNASMFALPHTFEVVDYDNNVLHSINDKSSPDTHCSGFHGSSAQDNTFALACDSDHGGIVVVNYEESAGSYETRAVSYPANFPEHRTGSFTEHPEAAFIVGNFAGNDQYHLMTFKTSDEAVDESRVLTLEARQCAYQMEKGQGELVIVLMPTGMLHVFEAATWTELAKVQIVEGMTDCSEANLVVGVGQAFVMTPGTQTMYGVDLASVDDNGNVDVSTTQLGFTPFSAVVAGIPDGTACPLPAHSEEGHDDHEGHDHDDHEGHDHSDGALASASGKTGISLLVGVACAAFAGFNW